MVDDCGEYYISVFSGLDGFKDFRIYVWYYMYVVN